MGRPILARFRSAAASLLGRRGSGAQIKHFRALAAMSLSRTPPICRDVAAWADTASAGAVLGSIGQEETIQRTLPPGEATRLFSARQTFRLHPRPVVRIAGATISGRNGFLVLPDGQHLLQTVWYPQQLTRHRAYYRPAPSPAVEKTGVYHSLLIYWSRQYYHWLTETLPLLHGLAPFLPAGTRHIVPGPAAPVQRDCLRLLGIGAEQTVEISELESWRLEELIFAPPATTRYADLLPREVRRGRYTLRPPGPHAGPFNHSPEGIRWLSARLIEGVRRDAPLAAAAGDGRIYISRRKANCRRLNDEEIAPVLAAHGVVVQVLEDLSFAEQVQLMNQAELIVAPHGAGLANLIFCRPGTQVIEIFEPSSLRLCFWSLSDIMGLRYRYLVGRTVRSDRWEPDIWIDPRALDGALREGG